MRNQQGGIREQTTGLYRHPGERRDRTQGSTVGMISGGSANLGGLHMSDEKVGSSYDARSIVDAINRGWLGRGFAFGLGLWLASVFLVVLPILLVILMGGGLAGLIALLTRHST
jgi:hypothetical protein